MKRACSKCHQTGHNARTCPKAQAPQKARKANPVPAPAPVAVDPDATTISVLEALRARRARLQHELAGIEDKRRELQIVESTIEQIETM